MKNFGRYIIIALCALFASCNGSEYVTVENGRFVKHGKPYCFVGTNLWYGSIIASDGQGGDYNRLIAELDSLKSIGITNLRVMVGSDGERGVGGKVEPTLQYAAGQYNDTLLVGLDRFLVELGRRDMDAVLFLNNSWGWTGGYCQYLAWAGDTVEQSQFCKSAAAQALFDNYVRDIVGRRNSITGRPYSADPAIFGWQIANEPRPFGRDNFDAFEGWIRHVAQLIKSIDGNHLVSIGSEGAMGCDGDIELWQRIGNLPEVDFVNIHIWPNNWRWIAKESLAEDTDAAIANAGEYIDSHLELARAMNKPITIEEFGFPRDGFSCDKSTTTEYRDRFYAYIFLRLRRSADLCDNLCGINFWGWGGLANPTHEWWQSGDDYTCDPNQEGQGLNSVFLSDSTTIGLIRRECQRYNNQ